jgi:hypothetical protein
MFVISKSREAGRTSRALPPLPEHSTEALLTGGCPRLSKSSAAISITDKFPAASASGISQVPGEAAKG